MTTKSNATKARWDLPGYEDAMSAFADELVWSAVKGDPLLGSIRFRKSIHAGPTRNVPGPIPVDHPLSAFQQDAVFQRNIVRDSDLEQFTLILAEMVAGCLTQMHGSFYERVNDITEATGSQFDMEGRPVSIDMILDMFDRLEFDFDDDGNPVLPTLKCGPEMARRLAELEPSEEQERRLEEIVLQRKAAYYAQKRTRRLSQ